MNLHDISAIEASRTLAETRIEDMDDYQSVLDIADNAHDVMERAHDRLEELIPRGGGWNKPFRVTHVTTGDVYWASWLPEQKNGISMPCDLQLNPTRRRIVQGDEPRLWVDNKLGDERHGKLNQYLCTDCAENFYSTVPPS